MVSDTVYLRLREFLGQFPLGFPETPSGVEIKILERLFTEEEAGIAAALTLFPEEVDQISKRSGRAHQGLEEKLESMSKYMVRERAVRNKDMELRGSAPEVQLHIPMSSRVRLGISRYRTRARFKDPPPTDQKMPAQSVTYCREEQSKRKGHWLAYLSALEGKIWIY